MNGSPSSAGDATISTGEPSNSGLHLWIVFAAGLLLYGITCAPGLLFGDSATFQFRVWSFDLKGELGLALAHPLYILMARGFALLPFGETAFRVNLFSAVCAAASLPLAFRLIRSMTGSGKAAICGTALLAVSHTFWLHAVIAEVYSLYVLTLLIELSLLLKFIESRRAVWFVAAVMINGLTTCNHLLGLLHLPGYALVFLLALRQRTIRPVHFVACVAAYLVGIAPYAAMIVSEIAGGGAVGSVLHSALFGDSFAGKVLGVQFSWPRQAGRGVLYFLMNFPTPLALMAIPGAIRLLRSAREKSWMGLFLLSLFAVNFVFAFRYTVPDQYVFFMPCYVIVALLTGVGVKSLVEKSSAWATLCIAAALLPAVVYEVAPLALRKAAIEIGTKRDIPGRDRYAYFIRPRKNGEYSAENFTKEALTLARPNGLLIADGTIKNALVYARDAQGIERGVCLHDGPDMMPKSPVIMLNLENVAPFVERGDAYACSNIAPYVPGWLLEVYDLAPRGNLFQIVERARTNGDATNLHAPITTE